jgi:DeoR family transcriptional regulator of aga operon
MPRQSSSRSTRSPRAADGAHPAEPGLLLEERRREIRSLIEAQGRVTTEELAERFKTSLVTIRGDLNALAETGLIVRSHGGALAHRDGEDLPIEVKQSLRHAEKLRIAAAAVAMIREGDTVLLDSGSTTGEIAKQLRSLNSLQQITVITNALNIAVTLAAAPHVRLLMLGGVLRPNSYSLSGPQAEAALAGLQADLLFLGVDSLDPEIGLMTPHLLEAQLNAQMIRAARRVVAVADSTKLLRRSLSIIAKVEQIHTLITDAGAGADSVAALRQHGVEVLLV